MMNGSNPRPHHLSRGSPSDLIWSLTFQRKRTYSQYSEGSVTCFGLLWSLEDRPLSGRFDLSDTDVITLIMAIFHYVLQCQDCGVVYAGSLLWLSDSRHIWPGFTECIFNPRWNHLWASSLQLYFPTLYPLQTITLQFQLSVESSLSHVPSLPHHC